LRKNSDCPTITKTHPQDQPPGHTGGEKERDEAKLGGKRGKKNLAATAAPKTIEYHNPKRRGDEKVR